MTTARRKPLARCPKCGHRWENQKRYPAQCPGACGLRWPLGKPAKAKEKP